MSRAIAIKLESHGVVAVVVRTSGDALVVEGSFRTPLDDGADAQTRGAAISAALAPLRAGRCPVAAVIPRSDLSWQNYDLPPSPLDDLPDLVHMQAQRDLPLSDDGLGFDFLPLSGNEVHPHRVLGIGVLPGQLDLVRDTCEAAELKIDRIVPEPLGWPEVGRLLDPESGAADALTVFAAIAQRQAIVWATEGETVRMVRTVWLAADHDLAADVATLGNDLRRTLMALSRSPEAPPARCVYCGANAQTVAQELSSALSRPVQAAPLEALFETPPMGNVTLVELAPLAALAGAAADGRRPHVDLAHPRRRPAPPSRTRSYALAAAAAVLAAVTVAWQGYRNLQEPLEAAQAADASRTALEGRIESLSEVERKVEAVSGWLGESLNVLEEMDHLSQQLRPEPLDSDKFKADQDLVLTKLNVVNRSITVDAAAKNTDALPAAETRLRAGQYRVDRGPIDVNSKAVPEYGVTVSAVIERSSLDSEQEAAP